MTAEPCTVEGRAGLAALRAAPGRALVALDFDGTLSPIVPDPADSRLVEGGLDVLLQLAGRVGLLALITGRPARTVVELGGLAVVPGLVVAGQYGAERYRNGRYESMPPPAGLAEVRAGLPAVLSGAADGVWVEDKGLSVVVHSRPAADPDGALAAVAPAVRALGESHGLEVNPGRYVLEIRPPGIDKGGALRRLVAEFDVGAVLFAGDDLGDLPAFRAVSELRAEGRPGLTVCSASAEVPELAESADVVVDGPAGVVAFLAGL